MSATWQWAKANPDAAARRIRELERENAEMRKERDALKDALEYEVVDTQRLHWLLVDRIKNEAQS